MRRLISLIVPFLFISILSVPPVEGSEENRVLAAVQKMESLFKAIEDYTCEVDQVFYRDGVEDQRSRFKFYFKKNKRIRVDFSHPYPSLSIFYHGEDKEATVMPIRSLPSLKFRVSIDNPMLKTQAGQLINQTDMGHFIGFVSKNLQRVKQKENEFYEDGEEVRFMLWALDYIEGKSSEKYRITISKKSWLPIRIERYSLEDKPIEITVIGNYVINGRLQEKLFTP